MSSSPPDEVLASLRHAEIEPLFNFLDEVQFWIKDRHGRYLKVNRAFQLNYSRSSPEEIVGLSDFDLSPPWLAETFCEDDNRVLQGEHVIHRLELVGGVGKTARWFRTTKLPVRDQSGQIAATAGITQPLPGLQAPDFPVPELAPALAVLQDDPSATWTNADLAKRTGMSVSAFERKFRRHLHTSPMQFLKRLRLARASAALLQTTNPISEIAIECGFADQAHLSREFRKLTGLSPSAWRQRHLRQD